MSTAAQFPPARFPSIRSFRFAVGVALMVATAATVVWAVDDAAIEIERIDGAGWSAHGIALRLELQDAMRAHATVSRLQLDASARELRNVRID
jgi:hypothetical protein